MPCETEWGHTTLFYFFLTWMNGAYKVFIKFGCIVALHINRVLLYVMGETGNGKNQVVLLLHSLLQLW